IIKLTARKTRPAARFLYFERRRSPPSRPIRIADVPNPAHTNQIIERFKTFFEGREWILFMQNIEIDVVGLEPSEARFTRCHNVTPGKTGSGNRLAGSEADFRGNHDVLPQGAKQFTEHYFRL